jgi:hypothetical protein
MDELTPFEGRFEERIRAFAASGVPSVDSAAIARAVAAGHPRSAATRPALGRLGWQVDRTRLRAALAAAAVVVVLVSGALLITRPSQPAVGDPTATPSVEATRSEPSTPPPPSPVTDPAGVWIPTGTMGSPRADHAAIRLLDGRVLVVGGGSESDMSAELYDPATGTWSPTGSLLRPYAGSPATLLADGRVLVSDVVDDATTGAELYDPASGTWAAAGNMIMDGFTTATLLRDGTVLVRGDGGSELFDPDSGTWAETASTASQRHDHAAILLPDGTVLVAGGHTNGDQPTPSAELYDPDTGTWTAIADMHAERELIQAFLQPDGKVLVVGGPSRIPGPQSAELYDPATGTWTATGEPSRPGVFVDPTATLLSDGRVLAGRIDSTGVELFDPDTGSWTTAAPMLRSHGTPAVLLLDGTVLVAGGRDCLDGVCVATAAAELYVPSGVSPPPLPAFPSPPPPVIPTPTPKPSPYPPATGPVPPNARPWTVTVVNDSDAPATLFLAEDGANGLGLLCGSVTPNVVPADTTMDVTFQLPPESVTDCWIWVNPVPGEGGSLFQTSDAPMPGQVFVTADGQSGWAGP